MKAALCLVVAIAAFALVDESAAGSLMQKRSILGNLGSLISGVTKDVTGIVQGTVDGVKGIVGKVVENLKETINEVLNIVKGILDSLFSGLAGDYSELKEQVSLKLKEIMETITEELNSGADVEELREEMYTKVTALVNDVWEQVKNDASIPENFQENLLNQLKETVDKWLTSASAEINVDVTV